MEPARPAKCLSGGWCAGCGVTKSWGEREACIFRQRQRRHGRQNGGKIGGLRLRYGLMTQMAERAMRINRRVVVMDICDNNRGKHQQRQ